LFIHGQKKKDKKLKGKSMQKMGKSASDSAPLLSGSLLLARRQGWQ
jgi:hypothetical protein